MEEIGPWHSGIRSDDNNIRKDSMRTHILWSILTAGLAREFNGILDG